MEKIIEENKQESLVLENNENTKNYYRNMAVR
jgi:hypothetical protein